MAESGVVEFVIQGMTLDGKLFRPSDWAERLCGVMSAFGGDRRMQYSPFVHPVTADRKSTRLNSSHSAKSRMPSSA